MEKQNKLDSEVSQSFWDHLEELRKIALSCACLILMGALLCFSLTGPILGLIKETLPNFQEQAFPFSRQPLSLERISNTSKAYLHYVVPSSARVHAYSSGVGHYESVYTLPPGGSLDIEKTHSEQKFVFLSPLEGFSAALKIALLTGAAVTSPIWLFLILRFISPALRREEKKLILPFACASLVMISLGFFLAFKVTLPLTNSYFHSFNAAFGENLWTLSHYLDYALMLLIAHGIAFEAACAVFFLIHFRFIGPEQLAEKRRFAIIAILLLSAWLTPPDVLSQIVLAIPLGCLYELAIFYGRLRLKSLPCPEVAISP